MEHLANTRPRILCVKRQTLGVDRRKIARETRVLFSIVKEVMIIFCQK